MPSARVDFVQYFYLSVVLGYTKPSTDNFNYHSCSVGTKHETYYFPECSCETKTSSHIRIAVNYVKKHLKQGDSEKL